MTHAELEEYAPNRLRLVRTDAVRYRNMKRAAELPAGTSGGDEAGRGCASLRERLAWALDRLPPLPQFSKQASGDLEKMPAGFQCGAHRSPLTAKRQRRSDSPHAGAATWRTWSYAKTAARISTSVFAGNLSGSESGAREFRLG